MSAADPIRDAVGLALAYVDLDDERLAEILRPYTFADRELHLLIAVLALVPMCRDPDEFEALLYGLALAGAGLASS